MKYKPVYKTCAVCGCTMIYGKNGSYCWTHDRDECDTCGETVRDENGHVTSEHGKPWNPESGLTEE